MRTKADNFRNAPERNFDLYVICLFCTNFEAFTTFSAIFTRIRRTIIDHSEFITGQCEKILSRANKNEIKFFEFGSIKRALRPHLKANIAG